MQNKGFIKAIAVLLTLICIYYLSFSFVTSHFTSKAEKMGEVAGAQYLDSIKNEKVWLGAYTFKQCQEMQIGLGLDLKGGMNVILEVISSKPFNRLRNSLKTVRTTLSRSS